MKWILLVLLFLFILGPLVSLFKLDTEDWRVANRESANLAPNPATMRDAVIQVYSAPAHSWRGVFSVHTWIAIKEHGASAYTTFQVIGWGFKEGKQVLISRSDIPDRNWFGSKPQLLLNIQGEKAEKLIPKVKMAITKYPYANFYSLWPGPNSNTFVAYIARQVPELQLALPPNSVGKDFLPNKVFFARVPSGTGYQLSFGGLLGILIAKKEGIEINILGLVIGVDLLGPAIFLPGLGRIGWPHHDFYDFNF